MALALAGCSRDPTPPVQRPIAAGRDAIRRHGCYVCHPIPGIRGPQGAIGPSLDHIGSKYYLAGQLTNTPDNLAHWIEHPHAVNPNTLMPEMGVSEREAQEIAVFLETLR